MLILKIREEETEKRTRRLGLSIRSETSKKSSNGKNDNISKHNQNNMSNPEKINLNNKFFNQFFKTVNFSKDSRKNFEKKFATNEIKNFDILNELLSNIPTEKYLVNYNLKCSSHFLTEENKIIIGQFYINSINKVLDENVKATIDYEVKINEGLPREALAISGRSITDSALVLNSPHLMVKVPKNNPADIFDGKKMLEIKGIEIEKNNSCYSGENEVNNDKLFTTEMINEEPPSMRKNANQLNIISGKKEFDNYSNEDFKLSNKVTSGGMMLEVNEKTSQHSSSNQGKKTFNIFNIMKMIQITQPSVIKSFFISKFFEIMLIICFFLVIYLISDVYVGNSYEPLEKAAENIGINTFNPYFL